VSTFDPVRRLDTAQLVDAINEAFDLELTFRGPAGGGNVGAGYVTDRGGRRLVLTWQPDTLATRHREIAELVDIARARGVPAPRYEHVLQIGADVAVLQEQLPGSAPKRATPELADAMVALNDRCRGALTGRDDVAAAELYLRRSGPGFCLHEPLQEYSARTRRLLARIRRIGATAPAIAAGDDLVHLDFQSANVLVDDDGTLSGIVDWDGAARGDADLDLVVLLFGLHATGAAPATIVCLEERLRTRMPPGMLRAYWAHMSLRMVDWAIRHYGPGDVDIWLRLAESGLDDG
jgi:aminoglycoside phosphotransferase (APT) family kinase protein